MTRFLRVTAGLSMLLGFVLALPGLLLLLGSSQITCLLVDREDAAHDAALSPIAESEPR